MILRAICDCNNIIQTFVYCSEIIISISHPEIKLLKVDNLATMKTELQFLSYNLIAMDNYI